MELTLRKNLDRPLTSEEADANMEQIKEALFMTWMGYYSPFHVKVHLGELQAGQRIVIDDFAQIDFNGLGIRDGEYSNSFEVILIDFDSHNIHENETIASYHESITIASGVLDGHLTSDMFGISGYSIGEGSFSYHLDTDVPYYFENATLFINYQKFAQPTFNLETVSIISNEG